MGALSGSSSSAAASTAVRIGLALEISADMVEVLAALDGAKRYGEVIASVATSLDFTPGETQKLRREALAIGRELLELGALCFE